jgi:hypothetical protein
VDLGFCFFKGEGAAAERIDFLGFPLFPWKVLLGFHFTFLSFFFIFFL